MKDGQIKFWRVVWYSVVLWLGTIAVSGIVALPWFYLVLPLVILLTTVFYFDRVEIVSKISARRTKKHKDKIIAVGLSVATFWFLLIAMFSVFEIAGFYYFDLLFYFSDPRNWLLLPLVLLVPVVYSIFLEQSLFRVKSKKPTKIAGSKNF